MDHQIHVVRCAEAHHNLMGSLPMVDPLLTSFGRLQCASLSQDFPYMNLITHIFSSPLRRTISTSILSFLPANDCGKEVHLLPELQATGLWDSDRGQTKSQLDWEFFLRQDSTLIYQGWNTKNETTTSVPHIEARARDARVYLRKIAQKTPDAHIVVVTHGIMAQFLTQDFGGVGQSGTNFKHAEYRSYQFRHINGQDVEAELRETSASRARRGGTNFWSLNAQDQAALKQNSIKAIKGWVPGFVEGWTQV
ncbi:histidine phosphatase superfamily [Camillea tinctor]|nr:histidine phosphatase superfamily [Camillea tinctor]